MSCTSLATNGILWTVYIKKFSVSGFHVFTGTRQLFRQPCSQHTDTLWIRRGIMNCTSTCNLTDPFNNVHKGIRIFVFNFADTWQLFHQPASQSFCRSVLNLQRGEAWTVHHQQLTQSCITTFIKELECLFLTFSETWQLFRQPVSQSARHLSQCLQPSEMRDVMNNSTSPATNSLPSLLVYKGIGRFFCCSITCQLFRQPVSQPGICSDFFQLSKMRDLMNHHHQQLAPSLLYVLIEEFEVFFTLLQRDSSFADQPVNHLS